MIVFFIKLIGIILGFIFPVILIRAISTENKKHESKSKYTVISSLCFGILVFIIMGFLPNKYRLL